MSEQIKEYGQRVAEAVRDACLRRLSGGEAAELLRHDKARRQVAGVDLAAIVASVLLPQASQQQPVAWMYDWIVDDGAEGCVIRDWLSTYYNEAHNLDEGCHNIRPLFFSPPSAAVPDELVDRHLDNVLRASGSALRYYTMAKTLEDMRRAMRAAMLAGAPKVQGGGE